MKRTMGDWDQLIRVIGGLILMFAAYVGVIGGWGLLGIIPFLSGAFRFCPIYQWMGRCKRTK